MQGLTSKPSAESGIALRTDFLQSHPEFVIVDLETNQRERGRHGAILEVGLCTLEQGELIDRVSTLINPDQSIDPRITQLTGIDDSMVVDAPRFGEVAEQVAQWTKNRIFVAHNVGFDYGHLRYHLARYGCNLRTDRLCTVKASRKLWPSAPGHSLGVLSTWLEIPLLQHHRAMDDARAAGMILQRMIEEFGIETVLTFAERAIPLRELPPQLDPDEVERLPDAPGILAVRDAQGLLLACRPCNDLYQGFADLHRSVSLKHRPKWNAAARLDWRVMPSSVLGRLLALHATWKESPVLGRSPRFDKGHIHDGIFQGLSSTGCVFEVHIRQGCIERWSLHRSLESGPINDADVFHPPLPVPSFLATALRQGRLIPVG
jgi:DNA polymerase III epsilon subunit family exonuclease